LQKNIEEKNMARDVLTNEKFAELFYDNFKLTNYAIEIAQRQIYDGNEDLNVTELLETIKAHPPEQLTVRALEEELENA